MLFKYSVVNSLACFVNNKLFIDIKIITYFKKGAGLIYYKNHLEKNIINKLKFFIFYINFNFLNYNLYIIIKPYNVKKYNNCLDLPMFFSMMLAFFKIKFKKCITVIGNINYKLGTLNISGNLINKINYINFKKKINFLIISDNINNNFFQKNKYILKFKYLYEIYLFLKRCLTQRKSSVFTDRLSRVQISQHLFY